MITLTTSKIVTIATSITDGTASPADVRFFWAHKDDIDAIVNQAQYNSAEDGWDFDIMDMEKDAEDRAARYWLKF